jgi:hypothetical protein
VHTLKQSPNAILLYQVLINHMDQTPKDTRGKQEEMQMRMSTAASFLGSQRVDFVHPSSSIQGLCNLQVVPAGSITMHTRAPFSLNALSSIGLPRLQMSRLVRSLEAAFDDPRQHLGCSSEGHRALLQQLKQPDQHTAAWMADWYTPPSIILRTLFFFNTLGTF